MEYKRYLPYGVVYGISVIIGLGITSLMDYKSRSIKNLDFPRKQERVNKLEQAVFNYNISFEEGLESDIKDGKLDDIDREPQPEYIDMEPELPRVVFDVNEDDDVEELYFRLDR